MQPEHLVKNHEASQALTQLVVLEEERPEIGNYHSAVVGQNGNGVDGLQFVDNTQEIPLGSTEDIPKVVVFQVVDVLGLQQLYPGVRCEGLVVFVWKESE